MKEITVTDAMMLMKSNAKPAVSIYLGTDHLEPDGGAKIRSNLHRLYQTVEALIVRTYGSKGKVHLLSPLKRAIAALKLERGRGGIAIYHSEDFTGLVRLPTPTRDLAVAAESYHLKPVLRCMQLRRKYYLLAMRKKHAELFLVTPDGYRRIERVEIFASPEKTKDNFESSNTWVSSRLRIRKRKEIQSAIQSLTQRLGGYWTRDRLPLLIAGLRQYQEAFRKECTYMHLLNRTFPRSVDAMDHQSLIDVANIVMEEHFASIDSLTIDNFNKAKAAGLTSTDLKEISLSTAQGQVESLLVAEDKQIWGLLDRENGSVRMIKQKSDAFSDDVLDDLAELTILKGGKVTVLPISQMPGGAPVAAILRWGSWPTFKHAHMISHTHVKPLPRVRHVLVEARA